MGSALDRTSVRVGLPFGVAAGAHQVPPRLQLGHFPFYRTYQCQIIPQHMMSQPRTDTTNLGDLLLRFSSVIIPAINCQNSLAARSHLNTTDKTSSKIGIDARASSYTWSLAPSLPTQSNIWQCWMHLCLSWCPQARRRYGSS